MERIILFDGVCNLCNGSVQFIIKRDPTGQFKFASLQSEFGQHLLNKLQLGTNLNSFVFIEQGKSYVKSDAALRVAKHLRGGWTLLRMLLLVPRPLRDFVYDVIANNRYKWFGKQERCWIPTPELRERFLD